MRIGEVAERAGINVETIRFYESKGLIAQPMRPVDGGYRDYPADVLHRIWFIQRAKQLGFSLREIDELLVLESGPDTQCADVRLRAETKLHEVKIKIENLTRIEAALQVLIEACPGKGDARHCSILSQIKKGDLHLTPFGKENGMTMKQRKIEIFSAGCPVCKTVIARVSDLACASCDVRVLDMKLPEVGRRAKVLGIETVPAIVIDGKIADCCSSRGVDENVLRAAGLGQPFD